MSKNNRYRIVIEKSTITIASHEKNDHRQCLDNILYHKDTIGQADGVSPSGLRLKNLHFFTLQPYNPHFLGSHRSDPMGS